MGVTCIPCKWLGPFGRQGVPSWTCNGVFAFGALINIQAHVESSSLKQRWVKCLLEIFVLTSANRSKVGRKELVLLRAIPGACCGAWGCQEMVRAVGNLTISHDVDTYPVLRFPARSPVWSWGG